MIKKIWRKIFGLGPKQVTPEEIEAMEPITIPPPPLVVSMTIEEAIIKQGGREGIKELMDCFYGTLVDREGRPGKKRHLHDGWREGISHPFILNNVVYDVQDGIDANVKLYEKLLLKIASGE